MSVMHEILQKLVGQADAEGVPLAHMIARELSIDEMDSLVEYLKTEMSENYSAIEEFMKDIEVPGSYDFSSMNESQLDSLQEELICALSDTSLKVPSEA